MGIFSKKYNQTKLKDMRPNELFANCGGNLIHWYCRTCRVYCFNYFLDRIRIVHYDELRGTKWTALTMCCLADLR